MTVHVLFFASLREITQTRGCSISTETNLSVKALAEKLEQNYEGLVLAGSLCAVNEQYAAAETVLTEGDTVAFFPPVSGG